MDDNEVEIRVTIRDETAAGAAKARAAARKEGEKAGQEYGTGFTKGTQDRLRNSKGQFTKGTDPEGEGEDSGRRFGRGFLSKFRASLSGGGGGSVSGLASKLIGQFTGAFSLSAKTLATGFSYQFTTSVAAGLASGAAKMVHGLAAIGALLPAIAGAAVLAFGTVKLAIAGVGDTLKAGLTGDTKKFEEGLKGLAPAARGFAHEVVGMRSQLDQLKNTVQQNFFAEFSGDTARLGKLYLPALRTQLGGTATSFGSAVRNAMGFLQTPKAVLAVKVSLQNMSQAVTNVSAGFGGVLQALLSVVAVGSTFLPKLTDGIGQAADRLGLMTTRAAETGKIATFIQGGIDKLASLGHTAERVWHIAQNVWDIFKRLGGFGSVLSGLGIKSGGLLGQIEDLTAKADKFFKTSAGGKAMAEAIRTIRELLNASMGMFAKLAMIIAPFAPQIAAFATAVENLMTGIVDAAAPIVEIFLGVILPAVTMLVDYISKHTPIIQGLLIGLFAAWVAGAGAAALETLIAAAPFIALGLIVAGLAALFITHFDTIKKAVQAVWHWVSDHWPLLLGIFTGPIGLAVVFIKDHWNGIVDFVKKLPGRIAAAASGMWHGLLKGLWASVEEVRHAINEIIGIYNRLPGKNIPKVPGPAAGVAPLSTGSAPASGGGGGGGGYRQMAAGGIGGGGWRELGERGKELMKIPGGGPHGTMVDVPPGSMVYGNGAAGRMGTGGGGGDELVVTMERTGDALIDAIMDSLKIRIRKRYGGDPVAALEYRR